MKSPDFSKIHTVKIRGKVFKTIWRKPRNSAKDPELEDIGSCDYPYTPGKELWVWPKQDPIDILMTILHEFTHGAFPDLEEKAVTEYDVDLKRFLLRTGIEVKFHPKK